MDAWPVGRGDTAFGSLAPYIQKTALDSAHILNITYSHVTITWIDRESGKRRTAKLTGHEFLRRFLQHVLPKGFVRCRHSGFLSAAARTRFARVRSPLHAGEIIFVLPPPTDPPMSVLRQGHDLPALRPRTRTATACQMNLITSPIDHAAQAGPPIFQSATSPRPKSFPLAAQCPPPQS